MIVTFTPNPSVDRTIEVDELVRGAVLRARRTRVDPGGKGVNVALALVAAGHKACAVLPRGGAEGGQLADLIEPHGIALVQVPITESVRANVTVVEPGGVVTKLNEPGPQLSPAEVAALVDATLQAAGDATEWVVCCGSLPLGAPAGLYADLVTKLRAQGVRVAVDTSGPALAAAVTAGPDLVKPNVDELAEVTGKPVRTIGDAIDAARELHGRGARQVLASLGADGAVLVDDRSVTYGEAPVAEPRSTVGAGDAALAGFLAASAAGATGPAALAEALAFGAAAAALPGSRMPGPADLDRAAVRIHADIDQHRFLKGPS